MPNDLKEMPRNTVPESKPEDT